jgi:hypothetical protein
MRRTLGFLVLGLLFFFLIAYCEARFGSFWGLDVLGWAAVAITLAVGMLNGAGTGMVFGLSSFFGFAFFEFYSGYQFSWPNSVGYLAPLLIPSVIFALFGYLPARGYLKSRSAGSLVEGFIVALTLGFTLPILYVLYENPPSSGYSLGWLLSIVQPGLLTDFEWLAGVSILGGITVALCAVRVQNSIKSAVRLQAMVLPRESPGQIRCDKCGFGNAGNVEFCGQCGSPLQEDETKIY